MFNLLAGILRLVIGLGYVGFGFGLVGWLVLGLFCGVGLLVLVFGCVLFVDCVDLILVVWGGYGGYF